MPAEESVTEWIEQLERGGADAAQRLWERYYGRLIALARTKLQSTSRRASDEEDVVLSAFNIFFKGASEGKFPRLEDRHDLWKLLLTITDRKAKDHIKYSHRLVRDERRVRGESVFGSPQDGSQIEGIGRIANGEPTPEFAAELAEECERLLCQLPDESLRQVALLKLEGYSNDEVADKLERTTRSVERKLQRIRGIWSLE